MSTETVFRTCTLCEAHCGLSIDVEDNVIVRARGDERDVVSKGYLCPKGVAIGEIHHDPDRLRTPLIKNAQGEFEETDWQTALRVAIDGLAKTRKDYGGDAVGTYIGNPVIHNAGVLFLRSALMAALGTKNSYSAASQDTSPRFATSYHMYGSSFATPVPDLDHTDYFFCIGSNPVVSNGSVMTAPNLKGKLKALKARGGKLVVVDPRRTETAKLADTHLTINPGTDAHLMLGMASCIVCKHPIADLQINGMDVIKPLLANILLEDVERITGISAVEVERLADDFASANASVAYSRIGICNNRHGTLATYATDLLNIVAGRLGVVGGAMFSSPAIDLTRVTRMHGMDGHQRWKSRVRHLPETFGDLPSATLADEMETPGDGQVRALLTFAGNPVLSVPNGPRLEQNISKLDFMVSIDLYVNETTQHADVILPPAWCLTDSHIDVFGIQTTLRNAVRLSPPVVQADSHEKADWEIMLAVIHGLGGGPMGIPMLDACIKFASKFSYQWRPSQVFDALLRTGQYGDKFLPWKKGLSMKELEKHPHGVDLGPLIAGTKHRVLHKGGIANVAPPVFVDEFERLITSMKAPVPVTSEASASQALSLIGRRDIRSNNSWMHNVPTLMKGEMRCTLYVHPEDAAARGIHDGQLVTMNSRVNSGQIVVKVTDEVAMGIVSMPHGWGHPKLARGQQLAAAKAGFSMNDWTDDQDVEALVGQSILNGIPVELRA